MFQELDLHVTNRCTTSCKYCCFSSNRLALTELSTQEIRAVLSDAKALGCNHVHFTGGEPLLRSDILAIVSYANSLGLEMRMQTNGMLLTMVLAKKLYDAGLHSIMISLDSDIEEIHDDNRGKGTWKAAVNAIHTGLKANMNVRVNSVLTRKNYDRIIDTARFVNGLGVMNYSAFYFSPIGIGKEHFDQWLSPTEYHEMWVRNKEKIRHSEQLMKMNIVIEKGYATWEEAAGIDNSEFTGCGGGCSRSYHHRDYMIVRCDGNVYPCIMAIDDKPLGNVRDIPLGKILNDSPVWNRLLPTDTSEVCKSCEHFLLCGEGCHYYPIERIDGHDGRCLYGQLVPLCPIMKYNSKNDTLGGSSDDVMT